MQDLDTSNCETDPLRFPGAIQPHGALLVLPKDSQIISAASDSCTKFLGVTAERLLGQPLDAILGAAARGASSVNPSGGVQPLQYLLVNGNELRARASLNDAHDVLIDIEADGDDLSSLQAATYQRNRALAQLRALTGVAAIVQQATEMVRGMTGFDRVMFYRFDEAWNGEVVGEARRDGLEPYLGLNYPATDIPKQARDLFQSSRIRSIPDVLYTPSLLMARGDRCHIDLGQSVLRSVAPVHIEYLTNMAVRATLVGSVIVEGRLWGLVSCQHKSAPKYVGPLARDGLGWLFDGIAAKLEATLSNERRSLEKSLALRRRHLVDAVRQSDHRALMHPEQSADLLGVVAADGFALIVNDSVQTAGSTPNPERIRELHRRRRNLAGTATLFASSSLVKDLGIDDAGDGVAGALFVSLHYLPGVTLIWFRNARIFSVRWAGDPKHMRILDDTGRFSPRKSFAQFTQNVSGQSMIWSPEELDSAAELVSLIEIEALREREAFAQTILNSNPQQVAIIDPRGIILSVNEAWTRFAAENSPPGGAAADWVGSSYRSVSEAAAGKPLGAEAAQAWAGIEAVLQKTLGHFSLDYPCHSPLARRWFRMTVYPMRPPGEGAVVAHEDITERKLLDLELEQHRHHLEALVDERTAALGVANEAAAAAHRASLERLRIESDAKIQSRKLEAMGTLAAGIAHDFNNILASIIGYAELAADELADRPSVNTKVAQIISGGHRARDLVARMLEFARERRVEPVLVDIVTQVGEALALLRSSLRPSIELAFQNAMQNSPTTVMADPTQIMQIVMNLCINAAHAMDNHGAISIGVAPAAQIKDRPPGQENSVCITVADTGGGMTPEVMERMFDPFFTTKAPGEGSGLGLSVVYGIVSSLGGVIQVHSSAVLRGTGTRFQVFLPLTQPAWQRDVA
jgi:light-regulated signal transduction histidine kinase (bacteriophytochrome)